jgi:hypothetical protein
MNIPNQFPEVDIFLADDGLVPILEEMAVAAVTTVEVTGVTCQEATHELRESGRTAAEQDVGVIREECPRIDLGLRLRGSLAEAGQEFRSIGIILDNLATLHPPQNHVVKGAGRIQASLTGHTILLRRSKRPDAEQRGELFRFVNNVPQLNQRR